MHTFQINVLIQDAKNRVKTLILKVNILLVCFT